MGLTLPRTATRSDYAGFIGTGRSGELASLKEASTLSESSSGRRLYPRP
jgi:hypothetical protein